MASVVKVEIQGSHQLRDKLGRFSNAVDAEAQSVLMDTAEYAKSVAQHYAPVDLGALKRDIYAVPHSLSVEVLSTKDYSATQEFGRRAGSTPPPWPALFGWAQRHGKGGNPFALAMSIGRKGFRGKFFMTHASQAADKYVRQRLVKASAKLQSWWYSG